MAFEQGKRDWHGRLGTTFLRGLIALVILWAPSAAADLPEANVDANCYIDGLSWGGCSYSMADVGATTDDRVASLQPGQSFTETYMDSTGAIYTVTYYAP